MTSKSMAEPLDETLAKGIVDDTKVEVPCRNIDEGVVYHNKVEVEVEPLAETLKKV